MPRHEAPAPRVCLRLGSGSAGRPRERAKGRARGRSTRERPSNTSSMDAGCPLLPARSVGNVAMHFQQAIRYRAASCGLVFWSCDPYEVRRSQTDTDGRRQTRNQRLTSTHGRRRTSTQTRTRMQTQTRRRETRGRGQTGKAAAAAAKVCGTRRRAALRQAAGQSKPTAPGTWNPNSHCRSRPGSVRWRVVSGSPLSGLLIIWSFRAFYDYTD